MRRALIISFCLLFIVSSYAQTAPPARPKLVVGLVVDQMRWDYLYRFSDRYNGGFKRLLREGFTCENTFIPYTPTYTAAGHASVYTGSVPALNGIISNYWYSRELRRNVYCTEDSTTRTIGSSSNAGQMSPRNMWANSVADELRIATNFRSKVIGIALKDRGAILPAGHSANAAFWYDDASGGFITSDYYMQDLPSWMKSFNDRKLPEQYLNQNWNLLYDSSTYKQSTPDSKEYEEILSGEDNRFPHITATTGTPKYGVLRSTPYGNTYTLEAAKAAIEGEKLGSGAFTDFLAVSLSSTDYIGHAFGPNSMEVEDTYLRLDRDLQAFFQYLDAKFGKGNYLFFMSADHGAANVPAFLRENKMPGGAMPDANIRQDLNNQIKQELGLENVISEVINYQIYLNHLNIRNSGKSITEITDFIINVLIKRPEITNAFALRPPYPLPERVSRMITNGYNQKLSGDIQFVFKPNWFDGGNKGTTHGNWNPYDAHIPLVWMGWKIKPGKLNRETYMIDIAPTVAALLNIQMPNAAVGQPITEITGSK